jgi:hypothetical protein
MAFAPAADAAAPPPWDPFYANQTAIADFGATTRPFGVAAGDFDSDEKSDLVVGRVNGQLAFIKGNGDGTYQSPTVFAWKQAFFNAWSLTAADVDGDGNLDLVWGANATSAGNSASDGTGTTVTINDGEVRVFYGNGDGAFDLNPYYVSGVLHNAGQLIIDAGTDAGSIAAADFDDDTDTDLVVGAIDGTNTTVKLLENEGAGVFSSHSLVSQPTVVPPETLGSPIYFPATSLQNSPWGLAFGDADGDGDVDLWVGDRALYVYLFLNDGSGNFSIKSGNSAVSGRPNVYLGHDSFRAAVGFTPALASGDVNGDGKADLVLGLQSGTQTPATNTAHDGEVLLDLSTDTSHAGFGAVADIGAEARGVNLLDANSDGYLDIVAGEYEGRVKLLRQLEPLDTDGDGISDYVDNAPLVSNAPRLDMNTDGSINHLDQLDNDFDTALGDPEEQSTWVRLGDVVDPDDDNDTVLDAADNCVFVANPDQADRDSDGRGDACDPLDNRDPDGDGIPTGPTEGDPLFDEALAAKAKWSLGDTHFVIRIDALGRIFQNEFTQLMTDAGTLSPTEWAAKCWQNYSDPEDPPDPCGTNEGTPEQALTLPGGQTVPITLLVIPKQLWTDSPVVAWINDRNDNPLLEIGQHGTYHVNNTMLGDWAGLSDRNFFSCELCGLTRAEAFELMKIGHDTLLGNYSNRWVAESGATSASPEIDWTTSAHPLLSFAPPFNASDTTGRDAVAELGYKAFSASVFEEEGSLAQFFSPEGSHHEQFDQFGMFHASADAEIEPPETPGGSYDTGAYETYLQSETEAGGLNTWLIEEVEWSGRPDNEAPRDEGNRENNTVYLPRWEAWMQLLEFVRNYPGGVAMTMGEVALAKGLDNAPTVSNPAQEDSDHDGIGDAIEGSTINAPDAALTQGQAGELWAILTNGDGGPIVGQTVHFSFDLNGDGSAEQLSATTDSAGVARLAVTPTGSLGDRNFTVGWDGGRGVSATDAGTATISAPDTTAPETEIDSGPTGATNETTPTFVFSSTDAEAKFECRLDSGSFAPCSSPSEFGPLADGPHTFEVRATDAAANTDPSPASSVFTVDTAAPETRIDSGPGAATNDPTPTFAFSSTELNSSFECRLDSGSFRPCSSPLTLGPLADGPHTFEVRATDAAANADPSPASSDFIVATAAPAPSSNCVVPKLRGRMLRSARKRVKRSACAMGRVRRRSGTARVRRVIRQKPGAGKTVPAGTKITVTVR